ncbi:MAG TPA: DUF2235 domain-containing protein [Tepidisphaeraceae bacterium]|jgi:uncharacterized protein (DUF2235 family)|nr:DUF2235 domain-containing protein [Tepidisphaeraceae bacterium]
MGKRIIFCADGTWDDPTNATNVYKLFKATATCADQIPYYDDGVGADGNQLQRLSGGALGDGIYQKIKDGYSKIAQVYEPNDEIFLFGFSRGAYTARSLAGMIATCGLPSGKFDDHLVPTAFDAYRDPLRRKSLLASLGAYNLFDAKITMIGVWDTVGALGIPALFGGVSPLLYGFLDTNLHPDVLHAYHALSIDERRIEFPPTLWTAKTADQELLQVWFSGVHCDVGGGYPETGLSDITLYWMMEKAQKLGMKFDDAVWAKYAAIDAKHALDQIHESWTPKWGFPRRRSVPGDSFVSNSVAIRCQHDTTYQSPNLTRTNGVPGGIYQIVEVLEPPVDPAAPTQAQPVAQA